MYRYERKFLVDELDEHQVKSLVRLHPAFFYEPYPPRWVNNLYLDTIELGNYHDNLNGAASRRKVRVRWYGELYEEIPLPVLEFKIKEGLVGIKRQYPLAGLYLDGRFCDRYFKEILKASDLPEEVRLAMYDQQIVLLNRYFRHYFATRDGKFRLTLDTNMIFHRIHSVLPSPYSDRFEYKTAFHRAVLPHRTRSSIIVELKYGVQEEMVANRVASFFPFRVTRISKYVRGLESVYF